MNIFHVENYKQSLCMSGASSVLTLDSHRGEIGATGRSPKVSPEQNEEEKKIRPKPNIKPKTKPKPIHKSTTLLSF